MDEINVVKILSGHESPETAFVIEDYPYGFRLRCKIRYWLEYKPKHGFRFVSQTTNPKRPGEVWNKPKAGTYSPLGAVMFLDENDHVKHIGLSYYCDAAEAKAWREKYGHALPEAGLKALDHFIELKVAYEAKRAEGKSINVAFIEAAVETKSPQEVK